jgi:peroxiredoxin
MKSLARTLTLLAASLLALVFSLPSAAQDSAPDFSGTTFEGQAYTFDAKRQRVVMVVLWRTDCAVCLNKMPELRANAQGWKSAPFDLLLVNLDGTKTDAETYDRMRRQVAGKEGPVLSFWHGQTQLPAAWRQGGRLPRTLIIDRQGKVVAQHEGRIPGEVWNQVADLLP